MILPSKRHHSTTVQYQDFLFSEDREKQKQSFIYGTPEFKQAYNRYIGSAQWRKLRAAVRKRAGNRCEKCGAASRLHIHHDNYDRFQQEALTDLRALCIPCHEAADREREARNQKKYEDACEEGRIAAVRSSFFTTKYGEDWQDRYYHEPEMMDEDFAGWIERKRELQEYD